jgi:hypothetical protein
MMSCTVGNTSNKRSCIILKSAGRSGYLRLAVQDEIASALRSIADANDALSGMVDVDLLLIFAFLTIKCFWCAIDAFVA